MPLSTCLREHTWRQFLGWIAYLNDVAEKEAKAYGGKTTSNNSTPRKISPEQEAQWAKMKWRSAMYKPSTPPPKV